MPTTPMTALNIVQEGDWEGEARRQIAGGITGDEEHKLSPIKFNSAGVCTGPWLVKED